MQTITTPETPSFDLDISVQTSIDMYTPIEVLQALCIDEQTLLDLVNRGDLAAYRLGGHLRFRQVDVDLLQVALIAA